LRLFKSLCNFLINIESPAKIAKKSSLWVWVHFHILFAVRFPIGFSVWQENWEITCSHSILVSSRFLSDSMLPCYLFLRINCLKQGIFHKKIKWRQGSIAVGQEIGQRIRCNKVQTDLSPAQILNYKKNDPTTKYFCLWDTMCCTNFPFILAYFYGICFTVSILCFNYRMLWFKRASTFLHWTCFFFFFFFFRIEEYACKEMSRNNCS
jgi:hypothetical protein